MAGHTHQSFYSRIDQQFDHIVTKCFKQYASTNTKLAKMVSRKNFLIRCRKDGIFPAHITNSFKCVYSLLEENSPFLNKLTKHIHKFRRSILSIEIQNTFHKINNLNRELQQLKTQIISTTDNNTHTAFIFSQEMAYQRILKNTTTRTDRKRRRLLNQSAEQHTNTPSYNDKSLFNATGQQLPPEVSLLLSLGPSYSLPYTSVKKLPIYHLLADVEIILQSNPDKSAQNRTRCLITNTIQNHLHTMQHGTNDDQLTRFCKTAVQSVQRFLKENPNLRVMPA